MNEYRFRYKTADGFEGEDIISAANSIAASEMFADMMLCNESIVVECECTRVDGEEEEDD